MLIILGAVIALVGLGMVLAGRANLPLGRLPGDFVYRGKNTTFYFPLATSIVISVVLSVVMYVVGRMRRCWGFRRSQSTPTPILHHEFVYREC